MESLRRIHVGMKARMYVEHRIGVFPNFMSRISAIYFERHLLSDFHCQLSTCETNEGFPNWDMRQRPVAPTKPHRALGIEAKSFKYQVDGDFPKHMKRLL